MSHLKKIGLYHNIQWHPLVLCIGLGIAKNSTQNSLFEPLLPIITLPQLKLPTHAIITVKKMFIELLPFGGRPAVEIANLNVGSNRIHERINGKHKEDHVGMHDTFLDR
jgi:hypothetical protein